MSLSQTLQHCSWSPWKSACVQVLWGRRDVRDAFFRPVVIPKELNVAVKIWFLTTSWNDALGGGWNKPKRAADFNGLIGISPAVLSLLHCRAVALNFPQRLIWTILQPVSRGCVQTLRGLWVWRRAAKLAEREWEGKCYIPSHLTPQESEN